MFRFGSFLLKFTKIFILVMLPFLLMFVGAFATMLIAIRGTDVTVPSVVGADKTRAFQALGKSRLRGEVVETRHSADVPQGHIMGQTPSGGASAKADSLVRLVISEGRKRVPVPVLVGLSFPVAQAALAQRGLKFGFVAYAQLLEGAGEEILDQNPAAGEAGPDNLSVNVLVNVPKANASVFIMPNLVGLDAETVKAFLERQRFNVNAIEGDGSLFSASSGRIADQTPVPGAAVNRNTPITLRTDR